LSLFYFSLYSCVLTFFQFSFFFIFVLGGRLPLFYLSFLYLLILFFLFFNNIFCFLVSRFLVYCSISFLLSTLLSFLLSFFLFKFVFLLSLLSSHFLLFLTDPLPGFFFFFLQLKPFYTLFS